MVPVRTNELAPYNMVMYESTTNSLVREEARGTMPWN